MDGDRSDHSFKIKVNSILEDYEVFWNQKLGCGVSGPVRPCKKKDSGETFALKCLIDKPRARREVKIHRRCSDNPHIVSIFDVYCNEVQFPGEMQPRSRLLMVMQLMHGGELFDRIRRQTYFTEKQAASYTSQIAAAIERCHLLGIAHRDIKPENLLMSDNSQAAVIKLSDFGFAKEDDGRLTTPHFTPYYVAPQILVAQKSKGNQTLQRIEENVSYTYDKSCDIWSMGVIVYIMLCGYPPFYSETPTKQITCSMKQKIMAGDYDFPREDWLHISPQAKDFVISLLKVNPCERLTVAEVLAHPWLREAPMTELNSPAVMLDQNALIEAQDAHAVQLTIMRLPENKVQLKNLKDVNNPILKKRLHSRLSEGATDSDAPPPKSAVTSDLARVQHLRNIIAHCIMPDRKMSHDEFHKKLHTLIGLANGSNSGCLEFVAFLQQNNWSGTCFEPHVDPQTFAIELSELVKEISTTQLEKNTDMETCGTKRKSTK